MTEVNKEIEKKEKLINVLFDVKNALNKYTENNDKSELIESLNKILEPLVRENERLNILDKIIEKCRNKVESGTIRKLFDVNIDKTTLEYMKNFIDVVDSIYIWGGEKTILVDFEFELFEHHITFLRFAISTNIIHVYVGETEISENYENMLNSIITLLLDIKETVQFESS